MDKQTKNRQYVTVVGPDDVQMGRGRPVVTSEGNQRFRALILQYKPEYSSSNRHAHKDLVARQILSIIYERGGKFLRKVESSREKRIANLDDSLDAWEIADEETSVNKVKQALREHESSSSNVDAPSSKTDSSKKRKKYSSDSDSKSFVEQLKGSIVSDLVKIPVEAMKSIKKKKKRENQSDAPISLAESIRVNASKLGTDFSFIDPTYGSLGSMTSYAAMRTVNPESTPENVGDRNFPASTDRRRIQSSSLELLGDSLSKASRFSGELSGMTLSQSGSEGFDNMMGTERQYQQEHIPLLPTMADSMSNLDTINKSIHIDTGASDSRREYIRDDKEASNDIVVSRTGSSSDEDKKPAAK